MIGPDSEAERHALIALLMLTVGWSLERCWDYHNDLKTMSLDELLTEFERVNAETVAV